MKLTVLDMVQSILSSMNGVQVNTIGETVESRQVAELVKTAFLNIVARSNLPEHKQMFQLWGANDITKPVLMIRPDTVNRIEWIKYDSNTDSGDTGEPAYRYVNILSSSQFMDMIQDYDVDSTSIPTETMTFQDMIFPYYTDRAPEACTILNDRYIIFNAYNAGVDTTLHSSKTLCYGSVAPHFDMVDTFIPDLDEYQFPMLLNEAKALAFLEMKQVPHELAINESNRQWKTMRWRSMQKQRELEPRLELDRFASFGRKGRRG